MTPLDQTLLEVAVGGAIFVAARYVHEGLHYVAAWLAGRAPRYNFPFGEVAWVGAPDPPDRVDRLIALAPQASALGIGVAAASADVLHVAFVFALLVIILLGGRKDYQIGVLGEAPAPAQADADGDVTPSD